MFANNITFRTLGGINVDVANTSCQRILGIHRWRGNNVAKS